MTRPSGQQGTVVVVAMLVVALAATAATGMLQQQDVSARQLEAARDYEQALWVLKGGTHWARAILFEDSRSTSLDHAGELWATGLPPTRIEQGTLSGEIQDQQGLFNLNNLVGEDRKRSERDVAALKRLLQALEQRIELADAIADWIGANQPLWDIGELHRVRGCDDAVIARMRQVATVLPRRMPVNVNTAPAEVLVAAVEGLSLTQALVLAQGRRGAPIRNRADFRARLPRPDLPVRDEEISVDSRFFLVYGRAQVGKADVRMQGLLQRDGVGLPTLVWQRML